MGKMMFRSLRADEVECRVKVIKSNGCSLLLYKDARCDMNILDETVGPKNWQRKHLRDNKNCIVSIWDTDKEMWIDKEDTGTESNTEAEKGLASDSFKRACFNWGIGRELYTGPFIWINLNSDETYKTGDRVKLSPRVKFKVSDMEVKDGIIVMLKIVDQRGTVRYAYAETADEKIGVTFDPNKDYSKDEIKVDQKKINKYFS